VFTFTIKGVQADLSCTPQISFAEKTTSLISNWNQALSEMLTFYWLQEVTNIKPKPTCYSKWLL